MQFRLATIRWRKLIWWASLSLIIALAAVWLTNRWLAQRAASRVFTTVEVAPARNVALVLGTSAKTYGGYANPFFQNRIEAAAALYHAGKVRHLILSGDNHIQSYDEPSEMRAALLERGVPYEVMTLDYAGFRTLDSLARAQVVFGQTQLIVISDGFHLPRALFLADAFKLEAVGFASRPVAEVYARKTVWREYFARVKAVLDVYVLNTQPRFYGPRVKINLAQAVSSQLST
jgi:SanA protein